MILFVALASCSPDAPADQPAQHAPAELAPAHFTVRGRWPDAKQVTYSIEQRDGPIAAQQFHEVIAKACAAWNATGIVQLQLADPNTEADVMLGWRRGHHGACEPFGGDTSVAHSGPVRSGTFVHFDADRKWVADAPHDRDGYSLYGTALHELGHVLGLGHSLAEDAVMRTGVIRSAPLSRSDLCGLQSLYGALDGGGVDAPGDLRLENVKNGATLAVLRGVLSSGMTEHAVFDVDGDGSDEVLVWRTDRAGNGELMVYRFDAGGQLTRTTGPMLGVMAPGSSNVLLLATNGERVLLTTFASGRRLLRRFDAYGVLQAISDGQVAEAELVEAAQHGNALVGDLCGDGQEVRIVPVTGR